MFPKRFCLSLNFSLESLRFRMEDLTDPEAIRKNSKCDRTVSLYGYTRGGCFKNKSSVHIPGTKPSFLIFLNLFRVYYSFAYILIHVSSVGCGDFSIHDMSFLPDPCPLPDKEKRRSLNEKEKLIYAPMSGVGGVIYDKDAVYIDLGGSHSHKLKGVSSFKYLLLMYFYLKLKNILFEFYYLIHLLLFIFWIYFKHFVTLFLVWLRCAQLQLIILQILNGFSTFLFLRP